jgi:hypothetical protein
VRERPRGGVGVPAASFELRRDAVEAVSHPFAPAVNPHIVDLGLNVEQRGERLSLAVSVLLSANKGEQILHLRGLRPDLNRSESYRSSESLKKIVLSVPTGCYGNTFAARRHHGFG